MYGFTRKDLRKNVLINEQLDVVVIKNKMRKNFGR